MEAKQILTIFYKNVYEVLLKVLNFTPCVEICVTTVKRQTIMFYPTVKFPCHLGVGLETKDFIGLNKSSLTKY